MRRKRARRWLMRELDRLSDERQGSHARTPCSTPAKAGSSQERVGMSRQSFLAAC